MNITSTNGLNFRATTLGLAVSAMVVLAACGEAPVVMTPELAEAAEEAGGLAGVSGAPVNCPAKIATPAPAAGTPTHDIVGVRPGMTYDEAVNVLRCVDNKFAATLTKENVWNLNHGGVDVRMGFVVEAPLTQDEEDARLKEIRNSYTGSGGDSDPFGVKPGKVRYTASTVGIPGDERVIHITSEQAFALDALPPVESLKASLLQKYGPPTFDVRNSGYRGTTVLSWGYDPSGQPTKTCVNNLSLSGACGPVINVTIEPDAKNFELATKLTVTSQISNWGYDQIKKAETDLATLAAKRRAEEVEKAKGNAEAPKL